MNDALDACILAAKNPLMARPRPPLHTGSSSCGMLATIYSFASGLFQKEQPAEKDKKKRDTYISCFFRSHLGLALRRLGWDIIPWSTPSNGPNTRRGHTLTIKHWAEVCLDPADHDKLDDWSKSPNEKRRENVRFLNNAGAKLDHTAKWHILDVALEDLTYYMKRTTPPLEWNIKNCTIGKDADLEWAFAINRWSDVHLTDACLVARILCNLLPDIHVPHPIKEPLRVTAKQLKATEVGYVTSHDVCKQVCELPLSPDASVRQGAGKSDPSAWFPVAVAHLLLHSHPDSPLLKRGNKSLPTFRAKTSK
jgi:hypothetical protein